VTVAELEEALQSKFPGSSIHVRLASSYGKQTGLIIEASDIEEQGIIPALEEIIGDLDPDQYSIEKMGSSLGASFFKEIFVTLTVAFFMMGLVFYYYFRSLVATSAALISAFFDLFITLGIITLLGVRLTSGGIASFLMMIGYSIDTSILLSTKLLKGSGKVEESLFGAMRTGLTMSAAGIAATGLSFLLTNNEALRQIMLILVIGLSVDVITTWIENTALLRIYLEKKNVKN
jgi:preprotein translocase subunit SecF